MSGTLATKRDPFSVQTILRISRKIYGRNLFFYVFGKTHSSVPGKKKSSFFEIFFKHILLRSVHFFMLLDDKTMELHLCICMYKKKIFKNGIKRIYIDENVPNLGHQIRLNKKKKINK